MLNTFGKNLIVISKDNLSSLLNKLLIKLDDRYLKWSEEPLQPLPYAQYIPFTTFLVSDDYGINDKLEKKYTTLYLSENGNDSNDGLTKMTPVETKERINDIIDTYFPNYPWRVKYFNKFSVWMVPPSELEEELLPEPV